MGKDYTQKLDNVIKIDGEQIREHLGELVRGSVEETLNNLLDLEADQLCNAARYERTEARQNHRAGHYERSLHTKAGEDHISFKSFLELPMDQPAADHSTFSRFRGRLSKKP